MKDPQLYARNVQLLMARCVCSIKSIQMYHAWHLERFNHSVPIWFVVRSLNLPATSHSFEDLLLMKTTRKTCLPFHSGMVVYQKANRDLNMDLSAMKKWLQRFISMDSDKDGFIKLKDFTRFLRVPNDACVRAVFNSADKVRIMMYNHLVAIVYQCKFCFPEWRDVCNAIRS